MENEYAPQARARSRTGMMVLDWRHPPTEDDLWPDRLDIKLHGNIEWPDGVSFHNYLLDITRHAALIEAPTVGRRYRSWIKFGSVKGYVTIQMLPGSRADAANAGRASIKLSLHLNPTRTRALAVRRNQQPLNELSLEQFFRPFERPDQAFPGVVGCDDRHALDGKDNFFRDAVEAGGTDAQTRARTRDQFLLLYEARLRELVETVFTPSPVPPAFNDTLAEHRPNVLVSIPWHDLQIRYAEVYAERSAEDPVSLMHRLRTRGLSLARSIRAKEFSGGTTAFMFETEEGFSHMEVPLTRRGNFHLSVYAKTPARLRFEIKYRREFSHIIRPARKAEHRIAAPLNLLIRDATRRLPWTALGRAAALTSLTSPNDMIDLVLAMQSASSKHPEVFAHLARKLMLTGGVHHDEDQHPGIGVVIDKLVRAGLLEHWKIEQKEARAGRRYGLSARYFDARLKMLGGFAPPDNSRDDYQGPEPTQPVEQPRTARQSKIRLHAQSFDSRERMRRILFRNGIEE